MYYNLRKHTYNDLSLVYLTQYIVLGLGMQPLTSYPDFQLRHCELNTYNYLLLFLDTPLYWDIRKDKKLIMIERIQEPMKDANKTQGIGTIQTGGQLAEYLRVS